MPFVSKAQQRACYAKKARGEAGSWNCDEWAATTDESKLPEHKTKKAGQHLFNLNKDMLKTAALAASPEYMTKQLSSAQACLAVAIEKLAYAPPETADECELEVIRAKDTHTALLTKIANMGMGMPMSAPGAAAGMGGAGGAGMAPSPGGMGPRKGKDKEGPEHLGPYDRDLAARVMAEDDLIAANTSNRKEHPYHYVLNPFVGGPLTELFHRARRRSNAGTLALPGRGYTYHGGLAAMGGLDAIAPGIGTGLQTASSLGTVALGGDKARSKARTSGKETLKDYYEKDSAANPHTWAQAFGETFVKRAAQNR
jgi:hypothetical protein